MDTLIIIEQAHDHYCLTSSEFNVILVNTEQDLLQSTVIMEYNTE